MGPFRRLLSSRSTPTRSTLHCGPIPTFTIQPKHTYKVHIALWAHSDVYYPAEAHLQGPHSSPITIHSSLFNFFFIKIENISAIEDECVIRFEERRQYDEDDGKYKRGGKNLERFGQKTFEIFDRYNVPDWDSISLPKGCTVQHMWHCGEKWILKNLSMSSKPLWVESLLLLWVERAWIDLEMERRPMLRWDYMALDTV